VPERPVALVTGASSGIGHAFARRLASDHDLVVVARDSERLGRLADECAAAHGTTTEVLTADLQDAGQLETVATRLSTGERPVRLLVNNAGFGTHGSFAGLDLDAEMGQVALNVAAVVRLSHAALERMMVDREGAVINVSSVGGFQPTPGMAVYSATKAFVLSFSEALHEETAGTGVKVMALCPGFTRTGFQERASTPASGMPGFVWMEAGEVVDIALRELARGRAVCIPGVANKAAVASTHVLPRVAVRKLAKAAGSRLG
jgi:hypothetical protein